MLALFRSRFTKVTQMYPLCTIDVCVSQADLHCSSEKNGFGPKWWGEGPDQHCHLSSHDSSMAKTKNCRQHHDSSISLLQSCNS